MSTFHNRKPQKANSGWMRSIVAEDEKCAKILMI